MNHELRTNLEVKVVDLRGKKVTVFGLARSGIAVAKLLNDQGAVVTVTDIKKAEELKLAELAGRNISFKLGGHSNDTIEGVDFIVVSPGVPLDIPILAQASNLKIPIYSEVEVAFWFCQAPLVAITGTNGKTTTTALIGEILKRDGRKVIIAGNIGFPLSAEILKARPDYLVVAEISSFQLEGIRDFRPHIGIVLNLTPDHLDRHRSFREYVEAKARLFQNQKEGDWAVLNADDPKVFQLKDHTRGRVIFFSRKQNLSGKGVYLQGEEVWSSLDEEERFICNRQGITIPGPHNLENALAAIVVSLILKVKLKSLVTTLKDFPGVEHRLEPVAVIKGVKFINDSKGTNVDSVEKSLQSFEEPILLIAGGRDKGSDFTILRDLVKKKVKVLILLGEAKEKMKRALEGWVPIQEVNSMEEAVKLAFSLAKSGEIVLLSPACASFDMFRDYEERGRVFKDIVRDLAQGGENS